MGGSWFARRVAAADGWSRGLHSVRFSVEQRVHLAALLIVIAAASAHGADDITFDPAVTQAQFEQFSRVAAQGIFPTPVQPARATGLLGFDIGVAATGVKVDTNAAYWRNAVPNNITTNGYLAVPRLVVSKGFGAGNISGSYAKVSNSGIKTYGGALDVPLIRGTLVTPEIALRASYATLSGVDVYKLKTYGVEAFISKGFGPVMPYGAIGRVRSDARGEISRPALPGQPPLTVVLANTSDVNRYTVGVRFSLLVPKIAIEATRGEVTSYAAKVSIGF